MTARVLRERGYDVIEAEDGRDALELAQRVDEVDLLVTDVVMPHMTGPELASELRALVPDITTLYVSGYSEDELPFDGVFVAKPYRIEHLARTVGMLLRRAREPSGDGPAGA